MSRAWTFAAILSVALLSAGIGVAEGATTKTTWVSVGSDGSPGNGFSNNPSMSAGGRFVAFDSDASNLVPGDTNGRLQDVFVRDRATGTTALVSVSSNGDPGNGGCARPSISVDGRFVAFHSNASNLVPGDTNGTTDVFVRDRASGTTTRVSESSNGDQGNDLSVDARVSADGRFVVFGSVASNLVPGDTNGRTDVFIRDLANGTTSRVSVRSNGHQGNGASIDASISAHGRFVAFRSDAANLVPGDTNGRPDVFIRDLASGTTSRVSVRSNGGQADRGGGMPSISAHGRFVAFRSVATNLVPRDTNGAADVFEHDRRTGRTTRVSVHSNGHQADHPSREPSISADGRLVAFRSPATNLVPGDTNGRPDVFVHDRRTGRTIRVSVRSDGGQANGWSVAPSASADGRFVAFESFASNLVPGDTTTAPDVFVYGQLR